jgi:hypothetical protein
MPIHSPTLGNAPPGFLAAWNQMVGAQDVPTVPRRRGRKPRVPVEQLLPALAFHFMQSAGTLSEHFSQLFDASLADSSWADRRARLPWEIFAELMRRVLRPLASRRQREAFWRGWRLIALDGTQFSLTNTPQIIATTVKARTRRGRAAFAKITTTVLLELGLHNPIAAAIGRDGQSEWALALSLLAQMPKRALVLADRLYGCAAFAGPLRAACERVGSHFLLRARRDVKPRMIKRLPDGSRLVRVAVHPPHNRHRILYWLELREIRVRVGRPGARAHALRLWTSLVDVTMAPATDLAQLYAQRWEHELYFREVKRQLRKTDLLQSHTVETAAQEIAAIVLVSALLAAERARAAGGQVPVLRVSFTKMCELVKPLWLTIDLGDGLLTAAQINHMLKRGYARMRQCLTPPPRARSCLRAVRQPMTAWPRLIKTESVEGPFRFHVI